MIQLTGVVTVLAVSPLQALCDSRDTAYFTCTSDAVLYLQRMSVKRAIEEKDGIYFITFTCQGCQPLFKMANSYDAVYKWFDYLKAKGHYITGYVILPNHLHVLIGFKALKQSINTIVINGKPVLEHGKLTKVQAVSYCV